MAPTTTGGAPSVPVDDDPYGRWRALAVLGVAMVLAMTTWFSAAAVLPQLRQEWGLGTAAASWLTIAVQLGFVCGALASATLNLADRIPPRRLVLYGTIGAAVANLGLVMADGIATAVPLRLVTGAFLAVVYPPALKCVATWFRAGRGTAMGVMVGALTVGSALPHLVRGVADIPWESVIVVTSALTVAGGLIAELVASDGPFVFPSARFDPRQMGAVLLHRPTRLASMGYFGHMWELYAMWAWFAVFFTDVLGGGPDAEQRAAVATFAVIGIGGVGSLAAGRMSDRRGRSYAASVALAASGAVAAFIGFMVDAPPLLVLVVGLWWGFWVVADSAQFSAIVTEVADQRYVGTAVTVQLAIGFTLTVVTIWLVPVVRDSLGWGWAFALLVPGPALGLLAMAALGSSRPRRSVAHTH